MLGDGTSFHNMAVGTREQSSSLKPVVRIENNLAEMVTRRPTKIAKTNLSRQKTWPPERRGQFLFCTSGKTLKVFVSEISGQIDNNFAEMVTR